MIRIPWGKRPRSSDIRGSEKKNKWAFPSSQPYEEVQNHFRQRTSHGQDTKASDQEEHPLPKHKHPDRFVSQSPKEERLLRHFPGEERSIPTGSGQDQQAQKNTMKATF